MENRKAYLGITLAVVAIFAGAFTLWEPSGDPEPMLEWAPINTSLFPLVDPEPSFTGDQMLVSQVVTQSQFETPLFAKWRTMLKEEPRFHSKQWEYIYIIQALAERGMLRTGKKGLGFGVGQEPLPSVFAKHGVEVVATDLGLVEATKLGWAQSGQHMSSIDVLNKRGIATDEEFKRLVKTMNVDMTKIPGELTGFDFTWSTCSLGHLGSLGKGIAFIEDSLATLKPGGIAVHTTELNLSSDNDTYETPGTSVYRKRDIQALVEKLTAQGHEIHVNFNPGRGEIDRHINHPPYLVGEHLKIRLGRYVVTSLGLIIRKNPAARS